MSLTVNLISWSVIIATLPLNFLPHLPGTLITLVVLLLSLALALCPWQLTKFLALTLVMFVWATTTGQSLLKQINELSRAPIDAEVQIEGIQPDGERLKIRILKYREKWVFPPVHANVKLQPQDNAFCTGQRWRMHLVLRPVHAQLNEGGFDRQRFALATHTPLTGRVKSAKIIAADCSWRGRLIESAKKSYQHLPWQGLISALAFGERAEVSKKINQLLRETGTAHLMAISGMHIALAASFGWLMIRGLQFAFPVRYIGYRLPLFCSLLVALIYSWLSGGNAPAMRAMLALLAWSILRLRGIHCQPWQIWSLCIALILFFDPLSLLSDSLWLSSMAVGGLLLWYHNFPLPVRFLRRWYWLPLRLLHLQLGMMLLLMPVQALMFHGISLSALVANLWAVPLVSLVTVPLILVALVCHALPGISALLWFGVDRSLALVFIPLQYLPHGWLPVDRTLSVASVLCWLILACLRFGWWRTSTASIASTALLLCSWRSLLPEPEWRVDMLDVGHGLAVVVSRNGEATLYDTGNRWPGGDAARSHILPWLAWQGLHVGHIIISHGHLDHIGGLASVQAAFPQASVRSALARPGHLSCRKGDNWRWQGLWFRVLWPPIEAKGEGNNQSCVVAVTDGKWRVLLTGDIEAAAEMMLAAERRDDLHADLLQVPHHGSRTSSTGPFLRAVSANAAIASAARYSAWRLPAAKIISRYGENGVEWRDTALSGQLSARFYANRWQLIGLREQIMNRWYHQWFGVPRDSG
ncbi:ComEC family protein [Erwinia tasmaniensis]|uniref:Competence-related protein n=1 Tax=Erwinia tasmaniensis (strain DSM 17950 / CFBP 7177 / CIP 109463 / NCPPB 4357 / Et1/99) TaxID=465817 RepID=B2VC75_ERWT9|nr:ComEC family protein [Erwinia tasmaniensis]CAO97186.1 Putative competence-related protein [Erwinia tasmaniensis Et1/99]